MLTKCFSSTRFDVELDFTPHGCQWHSIVIETAVVVRPCQYFGSYILKTINEELGQPTPSGQLLKISSQSVSDAIPALAIY